MLLVLDDDDDDDGEEPLPLPPPPPLPLLPLPLPLLLLLFALPEDPLRLRWWFNVLSTCPPPPAHKPPPPRRLLLLAPRQLQLLSFFSAPIPGPPSRSSKKRICIQNIAAEHSSIKTRIKKAKGK
jgi:hypothetical protein